MNPDQRLARDLADELNKIKPCTGWEFSTLVDICNCPECDKVVVVVKLDTHGNPFERVISKPFFLEDVRSRQNDLPEFANEIVAPIYTIHVSPRGREHGEDT